MIVSSFHRFSQPSSSTRTWLDELRCRGSESRLINCPANTIGVENCGHSEDIALFCTGCKSIVVSVSVHVHGRDVLAWNSHIYSSPCRVIDCHATCVFVLRGCKTVAYPARGSGCSSTPLSLTLITATYWIAGSWAWACTTELARARRSTVGDHTLQISKFPEHVYCDLLIPQKLIVQAKSLHQEVVPCQCLYNSESTSRGLETRLRGRGQRILNNGFDTDFLGDIHVV